MRFLLLACGLAALLRAVGTAAAGQADVDPVVGSALERCFPGVPQPRRSLAAARLSGAVSSARADPLRARLLEGLPTRIDEAASEIRAVLDLARPPDGAEALALEGFDLHVERLDGLIREAVQADAVDGDGGRRREQIDRIVNEASVVLKEQFIEAAALRRVDRELKAVHRRWSEAIQDPFEPVFRRPLAEGQIGDLMEPFRRAVRSRPSAAIPEGRRPSPAESEEAGLGSALAEFVATVERAGDAGSPARVESDLRLREWRVKVQQAGRRAAPSPTTKIGKPRAASPAKPVLTGKEATMREGATEPAAVPPEESSGLRRATVLGLAAAAGLVAVAAGRRYRASRIRGSG